MDKADSDWRYIGFARDYYWLRLLWIAPLAVGVFVGLGFVIALWREEAFGPMLFVAGVWLSVSIVVLLVALDVMHMLLARGPVVVVGPEGILDRRVMGRPLLWGEIEKVEILTQEDKPITVGFWPKGAPAEDWAPATLAKRLRLSWLAGLFLDPFSFAPLPVDLQTLDPSSGAILETVRRYWGPPTTTPLMSEFDAPPGD